MSFLASVEHFFSRVAHEVDVVAQYVNGHQAQIISLAQTGTAVASMIDPTHAAAIATVSDAAQSAFGKVAAALTAGDAAIQGGLLSIPADAAFKQSILDAIAAAKLIVPNTANASTAGLPTFTPAK
jgi:hypothetical protein